MMAVRHSPGLEIVKSAMALAVQFAERATLEHRSGHSVSGRPPEITHGSTFRSNIPAVAGLDGEEGT